MSACDEVKVAFLGLGIMGSAMSANLRKAGASVRGWNRSPGRTSIKTARAAGVEIVNSIEHAVKDARVIFSCVGDEHDSMQLLTGEVAKFASPNALIVDMGTIGQAFARNIGETLADSRPWFPRCAGHRRGRRRTRRHFDNIGRR